MQKKILSSVMGLVFLFAMLSMVSALTTQVYQENATEYTCNEYVWTGSGGIGCPKAFDGDWTFDSYHGMRTNQLESYENVTYSKILNSVGATWQIGYDISTPTISNVSIPSQCWNANSENITMQIGSHSTAYGSPFFTTFDCWNGTDFENLETGAGAGSGTGAYVVEEGVYWDVYSANPITDCATLTAGQYEINNNITLSDSNFISTADGNTCLAIQDLNIEIEGNGNTLFINDPTYLSFGTDGLSEQLNLTVRNLKIVTNFSELTSTFGNNVVGYNYNLQNISISNSTTTKLMNLNFVTTYGGIGQGGIFFAWGYNLWNVISLLNFQSQVSPLNVNDSTFATSDDSINIPSMINSNISLLFYNDTYSQTMIPYRNGAYCSPSICSGFGTDNSGTYWLYVNSVGTYTLVNGTAPVETPQSDGLIQGQGAIYDTMKSSGSGLGKFLGYMSSTLALLLIGVGFVFIIVMIGFAMVSGIKNLLHKVSK